MHIIYVLQHSNYNLINIDFKHVIVYMLYRLVPMFTRFGQQNTYLYLFNYSNLTYLCTVDYNIYLYNIQMKCFGTGLVYLSSHATKWKIMVLASLHCCVADIRGYWSFKQDVVNVSIKNWLNLYRLFFGIKNLKI